MYNDTEKRKYERMELEKRKHKKIEYPCIARFRVKQYEGQGMSSPDWDMVAVKNLSAGGMFFDYNKNLEIDSLLDLKIDVFKSIPAINCIGRVSRIEESQPLLKQEGQPLNSMFSIAIEFTEINGQEREMINIAAEETLRKGAKRKNFFLEKLGEMKNAMARRLAIAEANQENSTTLQKENIPKKTVKKKSVSDKATTRNVGIKKVFLKSKNVWRVKFRLPKVAAPDAKSVRIVGDFNNWDIHTNPMKMLENGDYTIILDLEPGKEYQFRYLIDESRWENDWKADKYVKSPYEDSDNSVVIAGN
ncbi:MAG: PilZ domain-containing protein [Candidatus Scalinduaceae bacterium]